MNAMLISASVCTHKDCDLTDAVIDVLLLHETDDIDAMR